MDLKTTAQVAEYFGLTPGRIRALARSRGLGQKLGSALVFTPEDIHAMRVRTAGRPRMDGNHYPLMSDVRRVMQTEGIDQDDAVRAFGVEP